MLSKIKNLIGTTFGRNTFKTARASKEFLLRETDFGTIYAETELVRRLVERTKLEGVHEIKNVAVEVQDIHEPLQIKLDLVILQNYSAPILGANLRDAIKVELDKFLGIKNALFDIRVTQINQNLPEQKKRRVR